MILFPASFFKDFPYPFPLQGPDLLLSYFVKLFHSIYQVTPSKYRELTLSGSSVDLK